MTSKYGAFDVDEQNAFDGFEVERINTQPRLRLSVAALGLVAFAGIVAFRSGTTLHMPHKTDNQFVKFDPTYDSGFGDLGEYIATYGQPVNCDPNSPFYNKQVPRWDPRYSPEKAFYNACYYSFRCCSTTANGNGCYAPGTEFGAKCRSCMKMFPPRMVKKDCIDWLNDSTLDTSAWTYDDLMSDNGVPPTENPGYKVMFANYPGAPSEDNDNRDTRSCWQPRGEEDKETIDFTEKCFEVLSWCNLLCPRDTTKTGGQDVCKHCTLYGFTEHAWNKKEFNEKLHEGKFADMDDSMLGEGEGDDAPGVEVE